MVEEPQGRLRALGQLWEEGRRTIGEGQRFVPGEGSPTARLMIVGEAPGQEEVAQGKPFVGRSGQLLNRVLAEVSIPREQTWVTNVFKARPTTEVGGRLRNRPPTSAEARAGETLLRREIEVIHPTVIICLGNLAAQVLISKDFKMNRDRGKWYEGPEGSRVTATFHPAYMLRQRGPERDRLLDLFRQDFRVAKQKLEEK
ncbi:MAG: uracil-DNA glycosylase [Chloroflexota bacterium]